VNNKKFNFESIDILP